MFKYSLDCLDSATPCAAAKIDGFDEDRFAGVPTGS